MSSVIACDIEETNRFDAHEFIYNVVTGAFEDIYFNHTVSENPPYSTRIMQYYPNGKYDSDFGGMKKISWPVRMELDASDKRAELDEPLFESKLPLAPPEKIETYKATLDYPTRFGGSQIPDEDNGKSELRLRWSVDAAHVANMTSDAGVPTWCMSRNCMTKATPVLVPVLEMEKITSS
jgi:hypothetical protein